MSEQPSSPPLRMSANDRREQILDVAIPFFANYGLHGASTREIAARAGISEAYIFRLFETKTALFIAAVNKVHQRLMMAYMTSAHQQPENPLAGIAAHMPSNNANRIDLLLLLQAFAATGDEQVQRVIQERFKEMYDLIRQVAGSDAKAQAFMGQAFLSMVSMAVDWSLPTEGTSGNSG